MFQTLRNASLQPKRKLSCVKKSNYTTHNAHIPAAIFFDWDGTIIKFDEKRFVHSFNLTLSKLNYPQFMHMSTLHNSKSIIDSFEQRLISPTKIQEAYNLFKEIFANIPISEEDLMPDAWDLLFQVNAYEIPTAVISNLDQTLVEKQVAMLKLTNSFDLIVGSARKPEYSSLTQAANTFKLLPNKAIWFIGDSRQTDILAANNAGFTSILINQSTLGNIKADIELSSLNEVIKLLHTKTQIQGKTI